MKEKVYEVLNKLKIKFDIHEHPALYTCADHDKYNLKFDGLTCKNLFLRNKNKTKYYLVSMPDTKKISLKELALKLNEQKLSFASEEDLFNKLKITAGMVSVLNVTLAEKDNLTVILDEDIINAEKVGFHPNDNKVTILLSGKSIITVLEEYDIKYQLMKI